jgi:hypothetical protein
LSNGDIDLEIKWKIREGTPGDRDGIIQCRQASFPGEDLEKQEDSYWQWEFVDNHTGPAEIFVACDGDKVVGHYAVIPQRYILDQKPLNAAIAVDAMTHPDYRYQKILTSIGRFMIEHCSTKTHFEFITAYAIRPAVLPGHIRVGWKPRFKIPIWVLPLSIKEILEKKIEFFQKRPFMASMADLISSVVFRLLSSLLLSPQKKYRVIIADRMGQDEYRLFWVNFMKQLPAGCVIQDRTLEYLQWKYESNPLRKYKYHLAYDDMDRLAGVMVTREVLYQGVEIMIIVDAWAPTKDASNIYRNLLNNVKKLCLKYRYPICAMMLTENNPIFESPLRFGFIPTPYRFTFITQEFNEDSIIHSDNLKWHLMWGDTDL